jgi:hypothetical protein
LSVCGKVYRLSRDEERLLRKGKEDVAQQRRDIPEGAEVSHGDGKASVTHGVRQPRSSSSFGNSH